MKLTEDSELGNVKGSDSGNAAKSDKELGVLNGSP